MSVVKAAYSDTGAHSATQVDPDDNLIIGINVGSGIADIGGLYHISILDGTRTNAQNNLINISYQTSAESRVLATATQNTRATNPLSAARTSILIGRLNDNGALIPGFSSYSTIAPSVLASNSSATRFINGSAQQNNDFVSSVQLVLSDVISGVQQAQINDSLVASIDSSLKDMILERVDNIIREMISTSIRGVSVATPTSVSILANNVVDSLSSESQSLGADESIISAIESAIPSAISSFFQGDNNVVNSYAANSSSLTSNSVTNFSPLSPNTDSTVSLSIGPQDPVITAEDISVHNDETVNDTSLYNELVSVSTYAPDQIEYSNILSDEVVDSNVVIGQGGNNLVVQTAVTDNVPTFKLITQDMLKQTPIVEENEFNTFTPVDYVPRLSPEDISDIDGAESTWYSYDFSFGDIELSKRIISPVSGYIGQYVYVGDCNYVELEALVQDNIEYSIIDGKTEIPILPLGQSQINDEKIFFNMSTRFQIDKTKDIIIKCNNEETALSPLDLKDIDFLRGDKYTISYTPLITSESSYRYFPQSDNIRLKIIYRHKEDVAPINIKSVTLLKYGVKSRWTSSVNI